MGVVTKPTYGIQLATESKCYKTGYFIVPQGIVVHSTGTNNPRLNRYVGPDDGVLGKNTYNNHWNRPENTSKGANAFIGKTANGDVMIYQTLPWTMRPWLCGSGTKGSYNKTHIQFEMCEDNLTNETYWRQVRAQAVHLCAWLCQEYNMKVSNVVGHYEAHAAGYANNHGDPRNWMKKFGDSMDLFRADVAALMGTGGGEEVPPVATFIPYTGTVQTKNDGRISLWSTANKASRVLYIMDGEKVRINEAPVSGTTMAKTTYGGKTGYVDTAYLINRVYDSTDTPGGTGEKGVFIPTDDPDALIKILSGMKIYTGGN